MVKKRVLLVTYLFLVVFCTISITLFTIWENSFSPNNYKQKDLFTENWNIRINDTTYTNTSLTSFKLPPLSANSQIVLTNKLPAELTTQVSLWIQTVYSAIEVSVNGLNIYSYGLDLHKNDINVGSGFHVIPINEDAAHKTIEIVLTTTQKNAFSAFKPVFIQRSAETLPGFLRRSILPLSSSIFLIILGAIGTIVCLGALFLKKKILPLLALSQFSLWVGMGVLTNTDLIQLFSPNFTVNSYLEYAALYATAFSLIILFLLNIAQTKFEKISAASFASIFTLYCLASITMERLHLIHLPQTLSYYQIICAVMILFAVVVSIKKIITKNGRILFSSISFLFLIFFCALDIGRYVIQKNLFPTYSLFYSSLLTIGVIIFIVSELLFYFVSLEAEISGILSFSELKFTPTDYTFLSSRKKIIQTVNELNKNHVYYTFVTISFSNVPNEKEAFKQYGKTITSLLKTVFDCYGLISYYDNNTFVIVVSEVSETKLKQLIQTFNQLLEYRAVKESFPKVKTSIGYAFSYESSYKSFKAVFSLAQLRKNRKLLLS
ncbi:MAG TPA: hypothetical protein PLU33_07040 [Treponemataceae bacterium]|nr:hypothetical protein [Treponemataceae bacterium]